MVPKTQTLLVLQELLVSFILLLQRGDWVAVSLKTSVESIDSAGKGENVIEWYISSVTETYASGSTREIAVSIRGWRDDWNANLTGAYARGSSYLYGFSDETGGIISPSDMLFCTFYISCTANESGAATLGSSYYVDISGNSSGSGQRAIRITFKSVSGLTPYVPTYYIYYKHTNGEAYATDSAQKGSKLTIRNTGPSKAQDSSDSTFTITGDANGGYFVSTNVTTKSITANKTSTTTYTFAKWNTNSSGTGTNYEVNTQVTMSGNITLYPKYTSSVSDVCTNNSISKLPQPSRGNSTVGTYTVTYNLMGGTASKTSESVTTTRTWNFGGWGAAENSTSADASSSYTSETTVWAYWEYNDIYSKVTLPTPTRVGYKFLGWGTSQTQTSNLKPAGSQVEVTAKITYYAIWDYDGSVRLYYNNTDKFKIALIWMYYPTSTSDPKPWKLVIPYMKTDTNWKITAG